MQLQNFKKNIFKFLFKFRKKKKTRSNFCDKCNIPIYAVMYFISSKKRASRLIIQQMEILKVDTLQLFLKIRQTTIKLENNLMPEASFLLTNFLV